MTEPELHACRDCRNYQPASAPCYEDNWEGRSAYCWVVPEWANLRSFPFARTTCCYFACCYSEPWMWRRWRDDHY